MERRQHVTIPFVGSMNNDASVYSADPPDLQHVENISYTKKNTLSTRSGFRYGADLPDDVIRLVNYNSNLLAFDQYGALYKNNYSNWDILNVYEKDITNPWPYAPSTLIQRLPTYTSQSQHLYGNMETTEILDQDMCLTPSDGLVVGSWDLDVPEDAKWVRVTPMGATTGYNVLLTYWDTDNDQYVFQVYNGQTKALVQTVSLSGNSTYSADQISFRNTQPGYAVCPRPPSGGWHVIWKDDSDELIWTRVSMLGSGTSSAFSSNSMDGYGMSICEVITSGTDYLYCLHKDLQGSKSPAGWWLTKGNLGDFSYTEHSLGATTTDGDYEVTSICQVAEGSDYGFYIRQYTDNVAYDSDYPENGHDQETVVAFSWGYVSNAGASVRGVVYGMHPISDIWEADGYYYGWAGDYLTRTAYLLQYPIDVSVSQHQAVPITTARYYQTIAQGNQKLQTVTIYDDDVYTSCNYFMRPLSGSDLENPDENAIFGLSQLKASPNDKHSYCTAIVDDVMYIAGGNLMQYNGQELTEVGWVKQPVMWVEAELDADTALTAGKYSYVLCYEVIDKKGNIHRSPVSSPVSYDVKYTLDTWSAVNDPSEDADFTLTPTTLNAIDREYTIRWKCTSTGTPGTDGTWSYSINGVEIAEGLSLETEYDGYTFLDADGNSTGISITWDESAVAEDDEWQVTTSVKTQLEVYGVPPRMSSRENLGQLAWYRTTVNGQIYYRMYPYDKANDVTMEHGTSGWAIDTNYNQAAMSFIDEVDDASIIYNETLYAPPDGTGQIESAPVWGGCKHLVHHADRLFTVSAEFPNKLLYSKPYISGEIMQFAPGQEIQIPDDVTGLASHDEVLLAFTRDRVYQIYGRGPDATGDIRSGVFEINELIGGLGCTTQRSIVQTPVGTMYQSPSGISLISTGFQTIHMGKSVETTWPKDVEILDSCLIAHTEEVVWTREATDNAFLVLNYGHLLDGQPQARFSTWTCPSDLKPSNVCYVPNCNRLSLGANTANGFVWQDTAEEYTLQWQVDDLYIDTFSSGDTWEIEAVVDTGYINFGNDAEKRCRRVGITMSPQPQQVVVLAFNNSVYRTSPDQQTYSYNPSYPGDDTETNYAYDVQIMHYLQFRRGRAWRLILYVQPGPVFVRPIELVSMTWEVGSTLPGMKKGSLL